MARYLKERRFKVCRIDVVLELKLADEQTEVGNLQLLPFELFDWMNPNKSLK